MALTLEEAGVLAAERFAAVPVGSGLDGMRQILGEVGFDPDEALEALQGIASGMVDEHAPREQREAALVGALIALLAGLAVGESRNPPKRGALNVTKSSPGDPLLAKLGMPEGYSGFLTTEGAPVMMVPRPGSMRPPEPVLQGMRLVLTFADMELTSRVIGMGVADDYERVARLLVEMAHEYADLEREVRS